MYCANCGHQNKSDAAFCFSCGEKLIYPKQQQVNVPIKKKTYRATSRINKASSILLIVTAVYFLLTFGYYINLIVDSRYNHSSAFNLVFWIFLMIIPFYILLMILIALSTVSLVFSAVNNDIGPKRQIVWSSLTTTLSVLFLIGSIIIFTLV